MRLDVHRIRPVPARRDTIPQANRSRPDRLTRALTELGNGGVPGAFRLGPHPKDRSMKSPWLKKNPMLSVFLSAANAWAGAARGIATGTAKRNTAAAITVPVKKKRRRRRS